MIDKSELIEIGKFQKTHALVGELNAILDVEEDFVDTNFPMIIEMEGIPVPFYPKSIRPKGKTSFLVMLDGIDNQEKAAEMVNKTIYARRSDLKEYFGTDDDLIDENDIIGAEIIDENRGLIGKLTDIDTSTVNTLLVVETIEGENVYIPFVDEFIISINPDEGKIMVDLPEGLLDINAKKDE